MQDGSKIVSPVSWQCRDIAYCCVLHIYSFNEMNSISFEWFDFLNLSKLSYCFENRDRQSTSKISVSQTTASLS